MMVRMNENTECAAPGCRSRARDGHVCTAHHGTIYADRTYAARHFLVFASDPDRNWMCTYFRVRALSATQALDAARAELAKEKREHWSIDAEERQAAA